MTISKHLVIPHGCPRGRGNPHKYFTVSGVNTFNKSDLGGGHFTGTDVSPSTTPLPTHGV